MKTATAIFFLFAAAVACKKSDKIPGNVLPKAKMETVLLDMMRADEFLGSYVFGKDSALDKEKIRLGYYKKVFELHRVNKDEFQRSFSFYRDHPAVLKVMMDSLNSRLTRISEEASQPKPVMTTDSFIKKSGLKVK